nr:MAG TPA: hypothetical protein [Caudoviricetes sp.]
MSFYTAYVLNVVFIWCYVLFDKHLHCKKSY